MKQPRALSAIAKMSSSVRRPGGCAAHQTTTKAVFFLLLSPFLAWSDEQKHSEFTGTWCSNPCRFGSTSRPWDLPCSFEISDGEIRWFQWDDRSKHLVRKYEVVEQSAGKETLLLDGGNWVTWYAHSSVPGAKHKLTLSRHHSNESARQDVELRVESWSEKKQSWRQSSSMYIIRNDGPCP